MTIHQNSKSTAMADPKCQADMSQLPIADPLGKMTIHENPKSAVKWVNQI